MAQNKFVKDMCVEFLLPLLVSASGIGLIVFWPFHSFPL